MRYIFTALALCACYMVHAQGYRLAAPTAPSVNAFLSQKGVSLAQALDTLHVHLNPADTNEGGGLDLYETFARLWQARVTGNDSSGSNMFQEYYNALRLTALAGVATPCGSGSYQGAWACIGPDGLPQQSEGKVDAVWADPSDTGHILAGCQGGLFQTTNGGANWSCITDNVAGSWGLMGVTSICVNPLNKNTIYISTGIPLGGGVGSGGASVLKSFDGGNTWQQEAINVTGYYGDSIENIQSIYMTPDSQRLYAFMGDSVYTRYNVGTGNTWHNITPPSANTTWSGLQFVPGNRKHFFISSNQQPGINNKAGIWYATDSIAAGGWTEITASLSAKFGVTSYTNAYFQIVSISMPDPDTLFLSILGPGVDGPNTVTCLYKYSVSALNFYLINDSLTDTSSNGTGKGVLVVSSAATTNNAGRRNIYFGWDVPYESWDGGLHFHAIGGYLNDYFPTLTHGDVRCFSLQQASNTLRGGSDRLFIATDGGVSVKHAGIDDSVSGANATHDISGKGLETGTFWSFEAGERDGAGVGGMMHDGVNSYQSQLSVPWALVKEDDAWNSTIDMSVPTRAYVSEGGAFDVTSTGAGREMGSLIGVTPPSDIKFPYAQVCHTDNYGNVYCAENNFWRKRLTDTAFLNVDNPPYTPSWGFPLMTLADTNQLLLGAYIAMNPADSDFDGYVLYNKQNTNTQFIYYRSSSASPLFYPSANNILGTVPGTPFFYISEIATNPNNTNNAWVSLAGGGIASSYANIIGHTYSDGTRYRVMYTPNHGSTWIDISNGLPQYISATAIVYDEAANMLYCATDAGIYQYNFGSFVPADTFRNSDGNLENNTLSWTCFSKGLVSGHNFPNVAVTELNINHCQGKLYAATYGRSIWASDLNPPDSITHIVDTIAGATTWSGGDQYITGSIVVMSGGKLTISGNDTVHMPKNGVIYVEPGGELIVNQSMITNDCSGCFWQGIDAIGNYNETQSTAHSGYVVIKNGSTIQHAVAGVSNYNTTLGSYSGFATTGGVIQATQSYFTDNQNDITMLDYAQGLTTTGPMQRDLSYFSQCTFLLDNNYKGDAPGIHMNAEVSLTDVYGVSFTGCQFLNRDTAAFSKWQGEGIRATDAAFTVGPYCSVPACPSPADSRFCGFINAIDAEHIDGVDFTVSVNYCSFDTVSTGVFVSGYNNVSVTNCNFKIGHGLGVNEAVGQSFSGCEQNIGIFNENCMLFEIENNTFTGVTSPPYDWYNYGVVAAEDWDPPTPVSYDIPPTLPVFNDVYRNTFDTLTDGVYAIGVNKGIAPTDGLQVNCNSFSTNTNDIAITTDGSGTANQGIAFRQGTLSIPAGNTFSNSTLNILDDGYAIEYLYDSLVFAQKPTSYTTSNVTIVPLATSNSCPSSFSAIGSPVQLSTTTLRATQRDLSLHRNAMQTNVTTYNSDIDHGNTSSLVGTVNTSINPTTLYTTLQGYIPYLSETVLKAVGARLALTHGNAVLLLEQNPDVLRDLDFVSYMNSCYSFTSTELSSMASYAQTVTARTKLENSIDSNQQAAGIDANAIMMALKSAMDTNVSPTDTTGAGICTDSNNIYYRLDSNSFYFGLDSIDTWLKNIGGPWSWYARMSFYNASQQYGSANNLLSTIKADTAVQKYDTVTYDSFYHFYNELYTAESAYPYGGVFPLSSPQMQAVMYTLNAADSVPFTNNYAKAIVANMARTYYGAIPLLPFPYPCFHIVGSSSRHGSTDTTVSPPPIGNVNGENTGSQFTAYPNPANGMVTFTYNVPNDASGITIEVTNMLGGRIANIVTGNNQGKVSWDTRAQPSGVYLYRASNDKGIIAQGKLILIR